jgi:hypothetical protein
MPSTIRDLTELTAVAVDDYFLVSDTSDVVNRDKRISQANMLGFAAIRSGNPVAGRVASWLNGTQIQDGGFAVSDIARLSVAQSYTALVTGAAGFRTFAATVNDQSFYDFAYTGQGGLFATAISGGANTNRYLLAAFRANSSPNMSAMSIGSDILVSTATPTGTTGTNGKATFSATSGHIYIENRLGVAVGFTVTLFI